MKRLNLCLICVTLCFALTAISAGTVWSQPMTSLHVAEGNICTDVVDRTCQNANTRFYASADRLYCFTKIIGAQEDTYVTHFWHFGDKERARIKLSVRSPNWRTFSSKIIQPHEIGDWHVDVVGADGQVLMTIPFTIQP